MVKTEICHGKLRIVIQSDGYVHIEDASTCERISLSEQDAEYVSTQLMLHRRKRVPLDVFKLEDAT